MIHSTANFRPHFVMSFGAVFSLFLLQAGTPPVYGDDKAKTDSLPEYTIKRTTAPIKIDGKLDESDWSAAESVGDFEFAWYESGKKEQTIAKMLWDDQYLYVAYRCEDAHISATRTERGSSVWFDDCVEVFTAPNVDDGENYFNIEMNVNTAFLEGHHPEGLGSKSKERWRCEGIQIQTTVDGTLNDDTDTDSHWILEAAIPFAAFAHVAKHTPPEPGDIWRLNLNRLGGETNQQYSQWSPSTTKEPQFHSPGDFGRVHYSADEVR
ncbi:carbohydrate-binding family 9-like protein [Polystyrenella longa]|nr:carbohydrate-binding family 9-like protein [Polystyrenella longa]